VLQFLHDKKGEACGTILFFFRKQQSQQNCTSGFRNCISEDRKNLELPVADMEIETDV